MKLRPRAIWEIIVEEHRNWANAHFGDRDSPIQPLLGIVEETGELMEALTEAEFDDMADAVADCTIFLIDFCRLAKVPLLDFLTEYVSGAERDFDAQDVRLMVIESQTNELMISVGHLAHYCLKQMQGIRYQPDEVHKLIVQTVCDIVCILGNLANALSYDKPLVTLVDEVWQKVRARDWSAKPLTAAEEL